MKPLWVETEIGHSLNLTGTAENFLKNREKIEEGTVTAIASSLHIGFKQAHREREEEYETLRSGLEQLMKESTDARERLDQAAAAPALLAALDQRLQRLESTLSAGGGAPGTEQSPLTVVAHTVNHAS